MEALKYQFTVKFTVIQYFQMLFELVSKVLPFYMVSFIVTTILSVTVVGELSIIGMITFFIIIFLDEVIVDEYQNHPLTHHKLLPMWKNPNRIKKDCQ